MLLKLSLHVGNYPIYFLQHFSPDQYSRGCHLMYPYVVDSLIMNV